MSTPTQHDCGCLKPGCVPCHQELERIRSERTMTTLTPEVLFGLQDQETLDSSPEDVMETLVENECRFIGESLNDILDRMTWPIRIYEHKRMDVVKLAGNLARSALEDILERLDEEHTDPGGDVTEPTEAMKDAALHFANVVCNNYVSWACEPTGSFHDYTREEAKAMMEGESTDAMLAARGGRGAA